MERRLKEPNLYKTDKSDNPKKIQQPAHSQKQVIILNPLVATHLAKFSQLSLRVFVWLMGAGYLFIEAREVIATKQLSNITIFAVLFILASYQLNVSRLFIVLKKFASASRCYRASTLMFIASLMAVFDASLDFLISTISPESLAPIALTWLFILGWSVNLIAVIFTLISMELFIPIIVSGPSTKSADWDSNTVSNIGN